MSEAKHTPEPWDAVANVLMDYRDGRDELTTEETMNLIATTLGWADLRKQRDDLLAACEGLLNVLTEPGVMDVDEWKALERAAEHYASATIARAKGE